MTTDPLLLHVAAYVEHVVEQVRQGTLAQADALAAMAADCLGMSLQDHVTPETADELLKMAEHFARQRYAIVNAAAVEVPDDPSGLDT